MFCCGFASYLCMQLQVGVEMHTQLQPLPQSLALPQSALAALQVWCFG